jgi:hypothetical protein
LEGFEDKFDFGGADVGRGKIDTGKGHWGFKSAKARF